jgi:hypothetical protein
MAEMTDGEVILAAMIQGLLFYYHDSYTEEGCLG